MSFDSARRREAQSRPAPAKPASSPGNARGAAAGTPAYLQNGPMAPGEAELKGAATLDQALPDTAKRWLDERGGGQVRIRYGRLARGVAEVSGSAGRYRMPATAMGLRLELFRAAGELAPRLVVKSDRQGRITGFIGLGGSKGKLAKQLRDAPEFIGLSGFQWRRPPRFSNELQQGSLRFALTGAQFRLGGAFAGSLDLSVSDESVSFSAQADIRVQGLEPAQLRLERDGQGRISGEATVAVKLPKNITGKLRVAWDGSEINGRGMVTYQGEKFSGDITLEVLAKEAAARREQQAKGADGKSRTAAGQRALVVFGEGSLDFAFTDWLTGTAQVIIDPKGHLTVIGEITPQQEYELFPQKDYSRPLFELEARARYGIPVVGNIFIFASVGMEAFASLGPGKFYRITVSGAYSTDPEQSRDFRIQGSLNISAAAGLRLRGEGGAGLEVLDHDIKAGAGVNGLAGIRGYAEATPIVGYREKPAAEGEDKQGEFFLRGELELAGQPFLGLSGDLFVEIDAPWWSPVPDKRWTWPLGGKEWPVGGQFGIKAEMDYVFGSGQWPTLEFAPVSFDADKFLTGLYSGKAAAKSAQGGQKGRWVEKNAPREPAVANQPEAGKRPGGVQPGGAKPAAAAARPRVMPGAARRPGRSVDPNTRTADGRTVAEYQRQARRKGRAAEPDSRPDAAVRRQRWQRVASAIEQALRFAQQEGLGEAELNRILKSIRRRPDYGLSRLYAKAQGGDWLIVGAMSPEQVVGRVKRGESAQEHVQDEDGAGAGGKIVAENPMRAASAEKIPALKDKLNVPKPKNRTKTLVLNDGSSDEVATGMWMPFLTYKNQSQGSPTSSRVQSGLYGHGRLPTRSAVTGAGAFSRRYIKGHLLNHSGSKGLGGTGTTDNLYPITEQANKDHNNQVEKKVKNLVHRKDKPVVMYSVEVKNESGPYWLDVFGDGRCTYQYIDATFACRYATYRLLADGGYQMNAVTAEDIESRFDVEGFKQVVVQRGKCPRRN